ncbi:hypothetical protein ZWY2020_028337, partial [Hordeum vulgare]
HFGDVGKVWVANQIRAEKMFEAENEKASDFVDASTSLPVKLESSCVVALVHPIVEVLKAEEQPLHSTKETSDEFLDASSSVPIDLEAKNDDASFITEVMTKEEEKLYEARLMVEEEEARKREQAARLAFDRNACFSKLDDLLTETQLYSEFLLENMEQITDNFVEVKDEEESVEDKNKGCGKKRKVNSKPQYNDKKAKTAVAAMLQRSREDHSAYDETLTEEERWEKSKPTLRKFMPKTVGPDFPIIITSYEMAMSDAKFLARYKWKYVVVDEGHRLKNSKCKLLRKLKRIPMANKLLLTGTPLQNNLAELWSLLNFILPDIFSSHQEFESWFDFSGKGDEEQQEEADEKKRVLVVSKLHAILRPFLLRRMKVDVEQMLPRKKEIIIYANLTAHQKQIQSHLIEKTFDNYLFESTDIVLRRPGMKMKLNNLMIQLRKNCAHPDLFNAAFDSTSLYPPTDKLLEQCGKFQLLDRLLESLLKRKHKVLIFSQWTKVLDIIEYYLYMKGLNVCRIDGSVKLEDRRRQIAEFNDLNSSMNVFILSTRAGGLGINLASADTCILYDSDWNPQMDLQAMDRCHRIGQTRPVHVYRLATSNSVEGRIIKRAFGKLKLEHVVIGKGQFEQNSTKPNVLDEEELLALLRDEQDEEDRMIQTDISDEDLLKVMDRSDLTGPPAAADAAPLIPLKGPGWEVVMASKSGGGMLSALTS